MKCADGLFRVVLLVRILGHVKEVSPFFLSLPVPAILNFNCHCFLQKLLGNLARVLRILLYRQGMGP